MPERKKPWAGKMEFLGGLTFGPREKQGTERCVRGLWETSRVIPEDNSRTINPKSTTHMTDQSSIIKEQQLIYGMKQQGSWVG